MKFAHCHQFIIFYFLIAITVNSSQILLDWMGKDSFTPSSNFLLAIAPVHLVGRATGVAARAAEATVLGPHVPRWRWSTHSPQVRRAAGAAACAAARLGDVALSEPPLTSDGPSSKSLVLDASCYRSHSSFPPPGLQRLPRIRCLTQTHSLAWRTTDCVVDLWAATRAFLKARIGWLARWIRCSSLQFFKCMGPT
jgi:hypothetical protein